MIAYLILSAPLYLFMTQFSGILSKLQAKWQHPIQYSLCLDQQTIALNPLLGQNIQLTFSKQLICQGCGKSVNKVQQGYCYPCGKRLACCDICMVKPERCHYAQGSCREPEWGQQQCFIPHWIYLANSSGIKVGITRWHQLPTRWIDQGASQAIILAQVMSRYHSGLMETLLAQHVSDKTNWRKMLKNDVPKVDLVQRKWQLLQQTFTEIKILQQQYKNIQLIENNERFDFHYPVLTYPSKVTSLNFDKTPIIQGQLLGIKGQYLILDTGVLNIRKFTGYQIKFRIF